MGGDIKPGFGIADSGSGGHGAWKPDGLSGPSIPDPRSPIAAPESRVPGDATDATTVCPQCGESQELAKVKGCIRCLKCGFKFDCNGW